MQRHPAEACHRPPAVTMLGLVGLLVMACGCLQSGWALGQVADNRSSALVARVRISEESTLSLVYPGQQLYQTDSAEVAPQQHTQQPGSPPPQLRAERGLRETGAGPEALPEAQRCRWPRRGEAVPRLQSVQVWRSSKPRRRESVTIVTQASLERVRMLRNQCRIWPDAIAAVAYVPTVGGRVAATQSPDLNGLTLEQVASRLAAFQRHMERTGRCTLDLELVTQDFDNEEAAGLYPINAARNRALLLAQSEAVLLLDADFVPSLGLVREYRTPQGYAALLARLGQPQAIVLPAFETHRALNTSMGRQLAMAAARGGKEFVRGALHNGSLAQFQLRKFARGHRPTRYKVWAASSEAYPVRYKPDYEPYLIVSRRHVPWYDERFVGFGRNKIQHIRHLTGLNTSFVVHPTAFVVHVPHRRSLTNRLTKTTGLWEQLHVLYAAVERDIRRRRFAPVVSFSPRLCARQGLGDTGRDRGGSSGGAIGPSASL